MPTSKRRTVKAPSPLVAALIAAGGRNARKFVFSEEAQADIREVQEVNKAGEHWITMMALARALKETYSLPFTVKTVQRHIAEFVGRSW